jgi:hypothetical protein
MFSWMINRWRFWPDEIDWALDAAAGRTGVKGKNLVCQPVGHI